MRGPASRTTPGSAGCAGCPTSRGYAVSSPSPCGHHDSPGSGSSGGSSGRLRWTGPGTRPDPLPGRGLDERRSATSASVSSAVAPRGSSTERANRPKMPGCQVVWLAPVPRSDGGRSAEITTSRRPLWWASITAGRRLATAVPEVVMTATGRRDPIDRPSARKPAVRSSMRTCNRRSPARSAAKAARASGADRDPGARTRSRTPASRTARSTATARSWAEIVISSATEGVAHGDELRVRLRDFGVGI